MDITKDLVTLNGDSIPVVDSLAVAEKYEKQHKDVLRKIEGLDCDEKFSQRNFTPRDYIVRGRSYPMYEMTRKGFVFLVTGFTGKKAAEFKQDFIDAFDAMEAYIMEEERKKAESALPDFRDPVAAARAWADAEEGRQIALKEKEAVEAAKEIVEGKLIEAKPKVEYHDRFGTLNYSLID